MKYFTHPRSYYNVPPTGMKLEDISYIPQVAVPCKVTQQQEQQMRDWVEMYRPVRERIVQSETTTDKTSTLPIAVYSNKNRIRMRANEDYVLHIPDEDSEVNH